MNCAIIGAGQLGSRHLQGLLGVHSNQLQIYVVDPSKNALDIASTRANEVAHNHQLYFEESIDQLPKNLDFVVVASNSKVRLTILENLLTHAQVTYLILEKVLFPKINDYKKATDLINQHHVKCWVNHPRRMFEDYHALKSGIDSEKPFSLQVNGSSWGLACNGLHFIDFFEYLTNSQLSHMSCHEVNPKPITSKRDGYIEFAGTIVGTLKNGSQFMITSTDEADLIAPSIGLMSQKNRVFIQETGTPKIYFFNQENNFEPTEQALTMKFQSQLTGQLFEQLMHTKSCDLPSFEHASQTHQIFLEAFLTHWNKFTGNKEDSLPIT